MSLIVVLTALPARLAGIPLPDLTPHWPTVVNILPALLLASAIKVRSTTKEIPATHRKPHATLPKA
ncbi:hypothetical protein [Flindersiella endophytica]